MPARKQDCLPHVRYSAADLRRQTGLAQRKRAGIGPRVGLRLAANLRRGWEYSGGKRHWWVLRKWLSEDKPQTAGVRKVLLGPTGREKLIEAQSHWVEPSRWCIPLRSSPCSVNRIIHRWMPSRS